MGATVAGIDYSPNGVRVSEQLFINLGITGDLRCEDAFRSTFTSESFDTVFSAGLIEHFGDPRPIVAKHFDLCRPGGKVITLIPNYGGIWGKLQRDLDPENLAIHNIAIMSVEGLTRLFPKGCSLEVRPFGCVALWHLSLGNLMPDFLASLIQRGVGLAGWISPITIKPIAPMFVAVARKANAR